MPKAAICFFGGLGGYLGKNGKGKVIDPIIGFDTLKKNLFLKNPEFEFDFFVHSWSILMKDRILEIIKPINSKFEEQIDFSSQTKSYKDKIFDYKDLKRFIKLESLAFIDRHLFRRESQKDQVTMRMFSRWYSTFYSNNLKKKYEDQNNFKYDLVFSSRFDLYLKNPLIINNLDLNYFYSSNFRPKNLYNHNSIYDNRNLQDQWFFSNSENMDTFSDLYKFINDYSRDPHRSSFQHAVKKFGKNKLKYILHLEKDYDIVRNVIKLKY